MSKKKENIKIDKKTIIRIVAISLAVVIIATVAVVAIVKNSPKKYVDEDGFEHLLYIDDEGNTVVNDNGKIVVYATDADGDILEDENGEDMTAFIDFPSLIVKNNTVETPQYKITMPKDWAADEKGKFHLKDNENVVLEINGFGEYNSTIDQYVTESQNTTDSIVAGIKEKYPASEVVEEKCTLTMKKLDCRTLEIKVIDDAGNVLHYVEEIRFVFNDVIYKISYTCTENSYDEAIDILSILDETLVMKETGNK